MKRSANYLLVLVTILAATVVSLIWLGPGWVSRQLAQAGLAHLEFEIESLSATRLSLSHIVFGDRGQQRIERLVITYDLRHLVSTGMADTLSVQGPVLHLAWEDGMPRLLGVAPLRTPSQSGEAVRHRPSLPLRGIEIRDAHLILDAPANVPRGVQRPRIEITGHGQVAIEPDAAGALAIDGELALGLGEVRLVASVHGRLPDGGLREMDLEIQLTASEIDLGELVGLVLRQSCTPRRVSAREQSSQRSWNFCSRAPMGLEAVAGRGSLAVRLAGRLPLQAARLLPDASATGRLMVELTQGSVPGWIEDGQARIQGTLGIAGGELEWMADDGWEVSARILHPGAASMAIPTGSPTTPPTAPARIALASLPGSPLETRLDMVDGDAKVATGGVFRLQIPGSSPLTGTIVGNLEHGITTGLAFAIEDLRLDPVSLTVGGLAIQVREAKVDWGLDRMGAGQAGSIALRCSVAGTSGPLRVEGGELRITADIHYAGGGFELQPRDCVHLMAERLALNRLRWSRPLDWCLAPPRPEPMLARTSSGVLRLQLVAPPHPLALEIGHVEGTTLIEGEFPALTLTAELAASGRLKTLGLSGSGGQVVLPGRAIVLEEPGLLLDYVAATISGHADSHTPDQGGETTLRLTLPSVRSLRRPALFSPLHGRAGATARHDGEFEFTLHLDGKDQPLALQVQGRHDFALDIGDLTYSLAPIRFTPTGPRPQDLVPALANLFKQTQGTLAIDGELSWIAGARVGTMQLTLDELSFDAPGLRVRGVETRVQAPSAGIQNRLAGQDIRIELLDMGIPLRNGLIRFHVRALPDVHLEKVIFFWGRGAILLEPLDLHTADLGREHRSVLVLEDVALDALFELFSVEGLTGTGSLRGRIPLRFTGSEILIEGGEIINTAPGVLRYRPSAPPDFLAGRAQTGLLLQALDDFHYRTLSLGLDGSSASDLDISISLLGSNPALQEGRPIKLRFNVGGELGTILRRTLSLAAFAERLGEVVGGFRQRGD